MKEMLRNPDFREKLYNLFKYFIYLLLIWNTFLFFQQDWEASTHTFRNGVNLGDLMMAFTASIDTLNWVILLLLFELETCVISDETLEKKSLKWGLMAVRALCYGIIMFAYYGYLVKMMVFYGGVTFSGDDVCRLVDGQLSVVKTLDDYRILNMENCGALKGLPLYNMTSKNLISDMNTLSATRALAWVDVANASAWLGVVAILEIDVWFQLKGSFKGAILKISKIIKVILYGTLLGCAVYWGFLGNGFLDFWDAFLWLLAFAFIEMNVFQWQEETQEQRLAQNIPDET